MGDLLHPQLLLTLPAVPGHPWLGGGLVVSPTIFCAQSVILLRAGVFGQGNPTFPAPGEAVQVLINRAAPATHVHLEVTGYCRK